MNQPSQAAARASGSSFYRGMRILPRAEREAMFEIYSFCRAVDDIADDPGPREPRREELQAWRADIDAIYAGTPPPQLAGLAQAVKQFNLRREDFMAVIDGMAMDVRADIDAIYAGTPPPQLAGLAQAVKQFNLRREDFMAVIDGMAMDVDADIRAPDRATLDLYCDRVACAVGRLSVRVFGMAPDAGLALARHLGRALQLTNILRDLDEDAAMGRLYLPREALREAGIISTDPAAVLANPMLGAACDTVVTLAREHFQEASAIMAWSPRRVVRAPRIMGDAYRAILDKLVARGFAPPRAPVRHSKLHLLLIVARNLV